MIGTLDHIFRRIGITYDEALVLFVSTGLIAVVCLFLTIYNIYGVIQDLRFQKLNQNLQDKGNSDE
jgi:hypothetical protein